MPTKPTSSAKSKTARANGAKSRGPVTPEGRARSSRNSLRHGLAAEFTSGAVRRPGTAALPPTSVVLPAESAADFQRLLDSYLDEFAPASPVEVELVETMAAARWRLRRLAEIETNLLANEIQLSARNIENDFDSLDLEPEDADRLAYAFKDLSDGRSLGLLIRYEGALGRSYSRAFKHLQILRSSRILVEPNEPKPSLPVEPLGDRVTPALTTASPRPPAPAPNPEILPESAQNPALSLQRATIEVPPRINDQHLHP